MTCLVNLVNLVSLISLPIRAIDGVRHWRMMIRIKWARMNMSGMKTTVATKRVVETTGTVGIEG